MGSNSANSATVRQQFEALALPHLDAVYSAALRLAGNPDDAKDLLQDTILRAYRFFDQFTPGTNCRAWLLTILYNNFKNYLHRCATHPVTALTDELAERTESGFDLHGKRDDPEEVL